MATAAATFLGARAHLLGRPPRSIWRIDGRDLKVELWPMGGLDLEADIRRRDLTCNALALALPGGELVDLVGGRDDIAARRLRAVSRANLADDPVRLLRIARFRAQLDGFEVEPTTARWAAGLAGELARAPRSRVGQELIVLLGSRGARRGLEAMLGLGLLPPAGPATARTDATWLHDHLDAAARLADARAHPVRQALARAGDAARLALMMRAWPVDEPDAFAAYSWPRTTREHAARAAALLDEAPALARQGPAARRLAIHRIGPAFPALLALAAACDATPGYRRWWRQWLASGEQILQTRPLLDASEVAGALGLEPGPELGAAIKALVAAQVAGTVRSPAGARRLLRAHACRRVPA
jgi:tRNA nucleotidyltransferase/poly(A) polymerase